VTTLTKTYGTYKHISADVSPTGRAYWLLTADPHVMTRLKRIFPRVLQQRAGGLALADTSEVARDIEWVCERWELAPWDFESEAYLQKRADEHRATQETVLRILGGERPDYGWRDPAIPARDYQMVAADLVHATGRLLLGDDVGLGKAQPLDALVLTPAGFRPMGAIKVGDAVIAAVGAVTQVIGVYPQGELECYRVTFSDGTQVECNDEHIWRVRRCMRSRSKATGEMNPWYWQNLTLREIIDRGLYVNRRGTRVCQAKWHVPMIAAPDLDTGGRRDLHPYLLGLLLGDGGFRGRGVQFSTMDDELLAAVQDLVPPGVAVKQDSECTYDLVNTFVPSLCVADGCTRKSRTRQLCSRCYQRYKRKGWELPPERPFRNPVIEALRDLGLWAHTSLDKFVPTVYKHSAAAGRLAILQGLMDTDGCAMPQRAGGATAQFYSSSRRLADDVRWLAESLGGVGRMTSKPFKGRLRYTVTVKLPVPLNPFRLSRKAMAWGDGHPKYQPTRAIVDVTCVGRKPMQCIEVDHPDHLYVTDGFVATHNTLSGALVLRDPQALPALVVTLTHLPPQWKREMARFLPWLDTHIVTSGKPYDPTKVWVGRGRQRRPLAGRDPDVLITSYSKLAGWSNDLAGKVRTVIFDEMQELRHPGTDKYAGAALVAGAATYRVGLTATPVYNYGDEIHSVVEILDPDVLGTRDEFLREWGGDSSGRGCRVADPRALGTYLRDQGIMLRRTRQEVGRELPPVVSVEQNVDCDQAVFDKLAGDAAGMAQLVLNKAADQAERWRAAGQLDMRMRHATGVAKAPFVAEFVRLLLESEERVVVWGWHRDCYAIWNERLAAFHPVMYTGSESPAQKAAAEAAFKGGPARVLLMSLRSGAGLDGLQEFCKVGVFGELDWSPMVHHQAIGRLARDGQADPVVAYYMLSDHGADPPMAEVLDVKRQQSEPLMNPDGALFTVPDVNVDRSQLLAREVLRQRGGNPQPGRLAS
jgi:hypothetical protein